MKGLYIHIPFCRSKCPYCDFYSLRYNEDFSKRYCGALIDEIKSGGRTRDFTENTDFEFDTVYFGGGTPSIIGGDNISEILKAVKSCYKITADAEITAECNPSSVSFDFFRKAAEAGVNRISLGMQSAVDRERKALGRIADKEKVKEAIKNSKDNGITNISLDIMLGVPNQTIKSLDETIDFCIESGVTHISAYMLTIEENTPFYKLQKKLPLPKEEETCEMYLHTIDKLKENGIFQYEISNFAKPSFESRHNLKYWNDKEYLGLGPSAHSFIGGRRFYFSSDTEAFVNGGRAVFEDFGGDEKEYLMLRLRLTAGVDISKFKEKFGKDFPLKLKKKAILFKDKGLLNINDNNISLTPKGFLVSNIIISELIDY